MQDLVKSPKLLLASNIKIIRLDGIYTEGSSVVWRYPGTSFRRKINKSAECSTLAHRCCRRSETDADDIALLYRAVGYHTVEEGIALVERSYPGRPIAAKVQFLLEEIVQSLDAE